MKAGFNPWKWPRAPGNSAFGVASPPPIPINHGVAVLRRDTEEINKTIFNHTMSISRSIARRGRLCSMEDENERSHYQPKYYPQISQSQGCCILTIAESSENEKFLFLKYNEQ
eukprot:g32003.t1